MVSTDDEPIDQAGQGVLFYLYSRDLVSPRKQLLAAGTDAGEIGDGTPGPQQQLRLADSGGSVLMVAQIGPTERWLITTPRRPPRLSRPAGLVADGRLEIPIAPTFALNRVREAYGELSADTRTANSCCCLDPARAADV
jgi:hypothetical protein